MKSPAFYGKLLACLLAVPLAPIKAQEIAADSGTLTQPGVRLASLPDAPVPQQRPSGSGQTGQGTPVATNSPSQQGANGPQQTKRILYIIPNFRSVSADTVLPPQSDKEKIMTGFEDSFDYSGFIFVGIQAGISQGTNSYPEFHEGAVGYGRYFWHTFVDAADENLFVESFIPVLTHEDSRYYTLGHGGFLKRAGYSLSRAVVTRNDSGQPTFNFSEIVGAGAASGISDLYYPGNTRTWTKTGQRWATDIIIDSLSFGVKEFWPELNRDIFHQSTD